MIMVEQIHESLNQKCLKENIHSGAQCFVVLVCLNDVYSHVIHWVTYLGLLCALSFEVVMCC